MTDCELDALVAEKVMGEHVHEWHATDNWNNDVDAILEDTPLWLCSKCGAEFCGLLPHAQSHHYSTSIADAMQVVEKMRGDGYSFECYCSDHRDYHNAQFYCSLGPCEKHGSTDINRGHGAEVTAKPSLPLAICLAALETITKVEACGKRVGKARK